MNFGEVWFSHRERIFKINKGKIEWTNEKKIWTWDRCTISFVKPPATPDGSFTKKLRVVVRSNTNQNQTTVKVNRPLTLRFMLGFDIEKVSKEVMIEKPVSDMRHHRDSDSWTGPKERLIIQLDDDYWIWALREKESSTESSSIYKIHQEILQHLSNPSPESCDRIFRLKPESISDEIVLSHLQNSATHQKGRIIPVIYHPAVDGLKNFVREVHCCQNDIDDARSDVEVTLIFNGERLRNNALLDTIYKFYRSIAYNRTEDVETFTIKINRKDPRKSCFVFKNIYSTVDGEKHGLNEDSVHGDRDTINVEHEISYYFCDYDHPVVFINTSNHAMAEHDANHGLWKWEYVPGVMDSPVCLGCKSRLEIDAEYKRFMKPRSRC